MKITQEELEERLGRLKFAIRAIKKLESQPKPQRNEKALDRYREEVNFYDDLSDEEGWSSEFSDNCDY